MRKLPIFPDPANYGIEPYLCAGGNLEPETLINAYAMGIFPWYSEGEPILWHCPQPRCVLFLEKWRISGRSRRKILHSDFQATFNTAFGEVIGACSQPRESGGGTWILPDIKTAYVRLHELGYAHSVEIWQHGQLAGGLYGVALGKVFYGESMFRRVNEGSRAALGALVNLLRRNGFYFLDCQQATPHMLAMGAEELPRPVFLELVSAHVHSLEPTVLANIGGSIPLEL